VAERVVNLSELSVIFLQDFIYLHVVALETTEVFSVYFFAVRENVIGQELLQSLRGRLTDLRSEVLGICKTNDDLQKLVAIQISLRIVNQSVQRHISRDKNTIETSLIDVLLVNDIATLRPWCEVI